MSAVVLVIGIGISRFLRRLLLRVVPRRPKPRWRFQKYDVAPRLGVHAVERRLRQALRQASGSLETQL